MDDAEIIWCTGDDDLTNLEAAWNELQDVSFDVGFFQSHEWMRTWWECYRQSGDQLLLGILKEQGQIHAILPLFVRRRALAVGSLRVAQFLGIEEVAPSSMDILASARGVTLLKEQPSLVWKGWQQHADLLDLAPVRQTSILWHLLGGVEKLKARYFAAEVESAPVMVAPPSYDAWVSSLGGSTRKDVRRKRAQLDTNPELNIVHFRRGDEIQRGLDHLAHLNVKRLGQLGKHGGFMLPRFKHFHHLLASRVSEAGRMHLFELRLGEQVLSAAVVYRFAHKWYAYQTGMDPDYMHLSPGAVLDSHVLEYVLDHGGASTVDFGLGHQEYKLRFGGVPQLAARLRIPSSTLRGRLIGALLSYRFRQQQHLAQPELGELQPCAS